MITRLTISFCLLAAASLPAQRVKVAVSISDSAARGVLQGAFVAAIRSLGDVDVVTSAEEPHYVLSGVVLCDPSSCQNPVSYSASLRLYSPLSKLVARVVVASVLPRTPQTGRLQRLDSLSQLAWRRLRFYEETHGEWVVAWGRERYEQAVREWVRRLDSQCFEKQRATERWAAEEDTTKAAAILNEIDSKTWLC